LEKEISGNPSLEKDEKSFENQTILVKNQKVIVKLI